jgi:DNA-binding beta-propeller fold protein YncE
MAGGPVLDLEQDVVTGWVGGNHLGSVALSPSGDSLYVSDPGKPLSIEIIPSGKLFIFDTRSNRYVEDLETGASAQFALTSDGKRAYVSNWTTSVSVIDLEKKTILDRIQPVDRETIFYTMPLVLGPEP